MMWNDPTMTPFHSNLAVFNLNTLLFKELGLHVEGLGRSMQNIPNVHLNEQCDRKLLAEPGYML